VGETQERPFQLSFNSSLRVEFQGARVTSDGGLILVRELDERLGFGELIERHLTDGRGKNTQLPLTDLVRPRYTADWRATRMSTTPSASRRTPPSGSSAPRKSWSAERR
jgi:Transposase DDE domain group 1